ncbi:MAG: TetR/AcrR family transcriptional regulator [Desulfobacterales bacterium]|nr:TetR/AcrR family transcriptional regulator [Desulfobacterales bacterium]
MGTSKDSKKTRAKIIEAAGQLFAEKGFSGVTVRDIAQKADTHLSALNYHFRTKEALHREVLLEACGAASIPPEEQKQLLRLEPRKALFVLVSEALKEYGKQTSSNWHVALINRECWEPSQVFGEVVDEYFKPEADFTARIIEKITDQPPDSNQVRFAVISLVALLETFGLYRHLIDAVAPGLLSQFEKKNFLAKQIAHLVIEAANPSSKE